MFLLISCFFNFMLCFLIFSVYLIFRFKVVKVLIDKNEWFRKNDVFEVINSIYFHNKCFYFVNEFNIRINVLMTANIVNHILKHLFALVFFWLMIWSIEWFIETFFQSCFWCISLLLNMIDWSAISFVAYETTFFSLSYCLELYDTIVWW